MCAPLPVAVDQMVVLINSKRHPELEGKRGRVVYFDAKEGWCRVSFAMPDGYRRKYQLPPTMLREVGSSPSQQLPTETPPPPQQATQQMPASDATEPTRAEELPRARRVAVRDCA